jgi:hypothetical protein
MVMWEIIYWLALNFQSRYIHLHDASMFKGVTHRLAKEVDNVKRYIDCAQTAWYGRLDSRYALTFESMVRRSCFDSTEWGSFQGLYRASAWFLTGHSVLLIDDDRYDSCNMA